eukprot:363609-Chlamydomonas_euryale.AAC.9
MHAYRDCIHTPPMMHACRDRPRHPLPPCMRAATDPAPPPATYAYRERPLPDPIVDVSPLVSRHASRLPDVIPRVQCRAVPARTLQTRASSTGRWCRGIARDARASARCCPPRRGRLGAQTQAPNPLQTSHPCLSGSGTPLGSRCSFPLDAPKSWTRRTQRYAAPDRKMWMV